ncbi:uncharacterized protein AKAME5_002700900 [Lates japonicus]|uniref:Uncharacterized protein n=1 Tax=Lates japonicus TaxID=270547 RepID=A0AAD3M2G8_LATJO|nr:uncharacterized protein AKAME5_002700900 [Lates japonicus]
MDQRRMDAEGGRVVHREWRARKFAVIVAVQNVLVAACLVVTLYVYWGDLNREQASDHNVHIRFDVISGISSNGTLKIHHIASSYKMSLADEKNDTIKISCTGPYVVYIDVCYKSLSSGEELTGILQLQVVGSETPVSNFTLQTRSADLVCRGLSSIAYLRKEEKASLHLYLKDGFKIKSATVGLTYLWGESVSFDESQ